MTRSLPCSISIIVLFHKGKGFLKSCLESLCRTTRASDEIIVYINEENKEGHDIAYFNERVKYIHVFEDQGYSKAANSAIEYASNEFVVFCDQDVLFQPGWLERLLTAFCADDNIGVAGIKLINHVNNTVLDFGIASSEYNFIHPHMGLSYNHPLVAENRNVQMVCSAVFLTTQTLYRKLGGFYEPFGTLYSDLDFCMRVRHRGFKVLAVADAIAYHFGSELQSGEKYYKQSSLKADVKGVFMKRNSADIVNDVEKYLYQSYQYCSTNHGIPLGKYMFCNLLTVVNRTDYENIITSLGMTSYDIYRRNMRGRDAERVDLFLALGSEIMDLGVNIIYFVDRFTALENNRLWWQRRKGNKDIIIDRHANIINVDKWIQ